MSIEDRIRRTIQITDNNISEQLISSLRDQLAARSEQTVQLEPLAGNLCGSAKVNDPEAPTPNLSLDRDVSEQVRNAIDQADLWRSNVRVGLRLRASRSLGDRLLELVRRPFHELAVFYVETMAQRQKVFNEHAVAALRLLAEVVQRQANEDRSREMAELKAEINRLREQVQTLERIVEKYAVSTDDVEKKRDERLT